MNLLNKNVVITGGAQGLGKALAASFKAKGAHVVIFDEAYEALQQTENELGVIGFPVDVRNEEEVFKACEKVIAQQGSVDIWINNSGIWMPKLAFETVDLEKVRTLFDVNFFGTVHGARSAIRQMKLQRAGMLINIISTVAFDGMNGSSGSMYVAAKYALRGLTNALREEVKQDGISVIGVYPGGMKTHLFDEAPPENLEQFMSPEEVAEKIIENIERDTPEEELVIKRPGQKENKTLK